MKINAGGELKVRVRGVNASLRFLAQSNDDLLKAAQRGVHKAAEYLMERIKEKFGKYQPTGGKGGGAWPKLNPDYEWNKVRAGFRKNAPLVRTGDMRDSFYVRDAKSANAIAAHVASTDPKLIHHIFGAPRAHVPARDPMLITAEEEQDVCHDIIKEEVYDAYSNMFGGKRS